jgi:hypothetical protein
VVVSAAVVVVVVSTVVVVVARTVVVVLPLTSAPHAAISTARAANKIILIRLMPLRRSGDRKWVTRS